MPIFSIDGLVKSMDYIYGAIEPRHPLIEVDDFMQKLE